MRQLIDCHIHTARCGHATGNTAEYVRAAETSGLSAMVLSDHLPLPEGYDPDGAYAMSLDEIELYVREVSDAAQASDVEVILGAEADWIPARADETLSIQARAKAAGIRVFLGSVHFIDEWAFDDPDLVDEWANRRIIEVWEAYFTEWCEAARSGRFDVMAHPDLVKKFGHRPDRVPQDLYREAARAAADGGVAIEVSTAGLRKPVGELYPGRELLSAFHDNGVPACVGSDAHAPDEVGFRLDTAYDELTAVGYDSVVLPLGSGEWRAYSL